MNVSVVMAVYNGMPFLEQQVRSVLVQLKPGDEFIISDSGSTDGSLDFIDEISKSNDSLKVVHCKHKRPIDRYIAVTLNFQSAIDSSTNDVVVLCDQDDVWLPGRLDFARNAHREHGVSCAVADGTLLCKESPTDLRLSENRPISTNVLSNFYQLTVLGCQLSLRKSRLGSFIRVPIHPHITHDWWWYVHSAWRGKVVVSNESLFQYRRHEGNNSLGLAASNARILLKIYRRFIFLGFATKAFFTTTVTNK